MLMSGAWRGLIALALAVALIAVGGAVTASAAGATGPAQEADAIVLEQRFARLPEDPGNVSVELAYVIPEDVRSLETTIPVENATVTAVDGFDRVNATAFEWDGTDGRASLTYRYEVNRTAHRTGPKSARGSYLAIGVGEWALFSRPATPTDFTYVGDRPPFDRRSVIEGEGAAGEWLVYLGAQQTFTRTVDGQTFRLVVPEAATMAETPPSVLAGLARASEGLAVGDRDEAVFALAAPTDGVPWAVRGLQTGDADMWVGADEELTDPENVWYHEYVHTRQSFESTPDARWLEEGIPAYYAARLTYEHQSLGFEGFADQLARGSGTEYADVVLGSPESWRGFADYYKGALAVGSLDRALRRDGGAEDGFEAVFADLNERERVNATTFRAAVARADDDVGATATRLTTTAANVSMWNESEHRAAFGRLPATIGYGLGDSGGAPTYRVSGPYRETAITSETPPPIVAGETMTVTARVENTGGTEGRYEASLRINGTTVDTVSGTVASNGTELVDLEHRFVLPGQYALGVDGTTVPVSVQEPDLARVTNVTVEPTAVDQGETASLEVSVHNGGDGPARRELIVTRNFREVSREVVYLDAGETKRVAIEVSFPRAGRSRVAVNGELPAQVAVNPVPAGTPSPTPPAEPTPTPTETPDQTTEAEGPGLGAVATAAAIVVGALLARRWR
jgi:hypothetical protein